jgi:hypothetical protein
VGEAVGDERKCGALHRGLAAVEGQHTCSCATGPHPSRRPWGRWAREMRARAQEGAEGRDSCWGGGPDLISHFARARGQLTVMPWMLSRRTLRWRLAPPLPRPLPPLPRPDIFSREVRGGGGRSVGPKSSSFWLEFPPHPIPLSRPALPVPPSLCPRPNLTTPSDLGTRGPARPPPLRPCRAPRLPSHPSPDPPTSAPGARPVATNPVPPLPSPLAHA